MIIKFDVASSPVSPFKFLLENSESVIIVMSANFHNIQFYSQWNSAGFFFNFFLIALRTTIYYLHKFHYNTLLIH